MPKKPTPAVPVPASALTERLARVRSAFQQLESDVDALRERRQHLLSEREGLAAAPVPADEARARIREYIALKADEARSLMRARCVSPTEPAWKPHWVPGEPGNHGDAYQDVLIREPLGFFAICGLGDAIERGIIETMCGDAGDAKAVASPERERRLAAIDAELADLEAAEETILRQGEEIGLTIGRRPDADPAVLLAPDDEAA